MLFGSRFSSRIAVLLLLAASAPEPSAASELGRPFVQNFPPSLYNRSAPTYGLAQDDAGLIYIGGFSVTLTYDGTAWGEIEMPFARFVNVLARAPDGTIYAGANKQLGFFRAARGAKKEFVSLVSHLPESERDFGEVTAIAATADAISFGTARKIFVWRDGRFSVLEHGGTRVFAAGGKIYAHREGAPLRRLDGDEFVVASSDPALTAHAIAFILAEADGALLVGTARHGLWELREGRASARSTELDERMRTGLAHGLRLADGTLVVAFETSGVAFLSREGRLLSLLDESNGLGNNLVHGIFADREGGLWFSHNNGASRSESPVGVTIFDRANGLDHGGYSLQLVRHRRSVFASTLNGIYRLEPAAPPRGARMARIAGTTAATRALLSVGDELFTASERALLRLGADGFAPVLEFAARSSAPPFCLTPHRRDPARFWLGQIEGLRSLRREGERWIDEGLVPGVTRAIIDVRELADGTLWLTKNFDGFMRVRFPASGPPVVEDFSGGRGLPPKLAANNSVVLLRDEPIIAIDYGLFRYEEARREFVPFEDFGPAINRNPIHIARLAPSAAGGLWLFAASTPPGPGERRGRRIYAVPPTGPWTQLPQMAAELVIMPSRRGLLEETVAGRTVLWSTGTNALVRIDVAESTRVDAPFAALVHAEAAEVGQRWSSERRPVDVTDPRPDAVVPPPARGEAVPLVAGGRLAASQAAVRFEFSAPRHRFGATPQFQSRLEGYEDEWTPWTSERTRIFTNLPAGPYAFHVRANDASGVLSAPAVLRFRVLPPWWQTWWMLGVYALAAGGVIAGAFRWRLGAIRRRNENLEALVSERTRELRTREEQLRVARDAAEAANRAKSAFLANMSHELRTPLNAVLGYAQLLRRSPQLPPESSRQIDIIHQSGEHLLQMINEVLDLAKVEAGKLELRPAPLVLPRFLAHFTEVFGLRAAQKGLAFNVRTAGPMPEAVEADEPRLRQVLYNLLGNALKFTERGHIELAVESLASGALRFSVTDTGVGIPAGERSAIFGPFHQAPTSPALAAQGAGLGLAISQRLVRLMGGEIAVRSALGLGSTFEFTLPLAPVAAAATLSAGERGWPTGYGGARRRVLIVDDEAVNRELLRTLLAPLGFGLAEAADGVAALATLKSETFDLVLLDLRLGPHDGLALARTLRASGASVKIVAVSASVFPDDRAQALTAGCDEFVAKPVDALKLFEAIGAQLGLEWTWRSGDSRSGFLLASLPEELPADWPLPPRAWLVRLDSLADLGDLPALREEISAARDAHAEAVRFLAGLDTLAGRALLPRLRRWLATALQRAS